MLASQIKTASALKAFVEEYNPNSKFFSRPAMKFFGDTMQNYGVRRVTGTDCSGVPMDAFELYRRKPVHCGLQTSAYFCPVTFRQLPGFKENT